MTTPHKDSNINRYKQKVHSHAFMNVCYVFIQIYQHTEWINWQNKTPFINNKNPDLCFVNKKAKQTWIFFRTCLGWLKSIEWAIYIKGKLIKHVRHIRFVHRITKIHKPKKKLKMKFAIVALFIACVVAQGYSCPVSIKRY